MNGHIIEGKRNHKINDTKHSKHLKLNPLVYKKATTYTQKHEKNNNNNVTIKPSRIVNKPNTKYT